ncbi:MAG: hypothetical protein AAGA03_17740, partial [Planctomycetota bacterium]
LAGTDRVERVDLLKSLKQNPVPAIEEAMPTIAETLRQEGLEKGLEKGREIGELIGAISQLQKVLGIPVEDRSELAERPLGDLRMQLKALSDQFEQGS